MRLLPAAAERFIELHYAEQLIQTNLRQIQLGLKQIAVGIERVELRIHAAAVADVGQPLAILQRGDQRFLLDAALAHSLVGDQGVGDFGERGLDGLLVLDQRAVALRFGEPDVGFQPSRGEDRLRHLRDETPRAVRPAEQARELRALPAQEAAQADLRKVGGFGHADLALAAIRFCSAARISGRRSSSADGRPAGTSGGSSCSVKLASAGDAVRDSCRAAG